MQPVSGKPAFSQPIVKQTTNNKIYLDWESPKTATYTETYSEKYLYFKGAKYDGKSHQIPVYINRKRLASNVTGVTASLSNMEFEDLNSSDLNNITGLNEIGEQIGVTSSVTYFKKTPHARISFVPIRKNPSTGIFQKLTSFDLDVIPTEFSSANNKMKKAQYAANSVLESGSWYKISVTQNGIYKLTYTFLKNIGIDVANINPQNLRLYGNGGGMMPYDNSVFRYDDLEENAIEVVGEVDGSFDGTDYILFYGEGPTSWSYSSSDNRYKHQLNLYSEKTYYFLTTDGGTGTPKRITTLASEPSFNTAVTNFDDYDFHEAEIENLIISGRQWYGEKFDVLTSYSFPFSFPNLSSSVTLEVSVLGRAIAPATGGFSVKGNGSPLSSLDLYTSSVNGNYLNDYGVPKTDVTTFSSGDAITISVSYSKSEPSSVGWLNYIELNARRELKMSGNQMGFRDIQSVGAGNISKFSISNATSSLRVWEVTNPTNCGEWTTALSGSTLEFNVMTDSLRHFIAFNGNTYLSATAGGSVANQNIHGLIGQPEFVIVTHPDFKAQADDLASFHRTKDNMTVAVVTNADVYNEFSSGAQDITAIKDLMRMLYNRAADSTELPKYLLLFGDGSYDNLHRLSNNTNYIPTYQSADSYRPVWSYVSDDYFGLLDNSEGDGANDDIDIGIGRFPVQTASEAEAMVYKVTNYNSSNTMRDWRNIICFIADDEDSNIHVDPTDDIATYIDTTYCEYNIDKIYLDAYQQVSSAGGQRYPEANVALNRRVEKGALLINYTGHGGELGWAHERILENSDINSWSNLNRLPVFTTATCEFSRFDDPARTAAGEFVYLNPNGGGIALLTTVRLVFSGANQTLTNNFYKTVFVPINGEMPRLGDVVMITKNKTGNGINSRKYCLLGDPALRMAYPEHKVLTDSINGQVIMGDLDTLKALSLVTISGHINNKAGGKYTSFNGTVYPTVYDKAVVITTLKNDPASNIINFYLQKSILFRGKATVTNGEFSYSFIVPKDIAYQNDFGRISYYAENGVTDAHGCYEEFIIGGSSSNIAADKTGPEVDLYMNDTSFVFGGITDENPTLLAFIFDEHGINTSGNGIGHDIVAILDGETNNPIVLNDDYIADRDTYKSGFISYDFSNLEEGNHTLSLKVWDVYNNSTEAITEFIVANSADLVLSHVLNYPNPFTTYTEFWFEHNRPGQSLEVQIQIFTISGRLIKTINTNVFTLGYRPDPKVYTDLQWNGKDDFGDNIGRGVYVYHLKVKAEDGSFADKFEKLVILN